MVAAVASHEQASAVGQINKVVEKVDQITQRNAAGAAELASPADGLASQARALQDVMRRFTVSRASA